MSVLNGARVTRQRGEMLLLRDVYKSPAAVGVLILGQNKDLLLGARQVQTVQLEWTQAKAVSGASPAVTPGGPGSPHAHP